MTQPDSRNSVLDSIRQRRSRPASNLPQQPDPLSVVPVPSVAENIQPSREEPVASPTEPAPEPVDPAPLVLPDIPAPLKDFRVRMEAELYEQLRDLCEQHRIDNSTLVESLLLVAQDNSQFLEQVLEAAAKRQEKRDEDARLRYVQGLLSKTNRTARKSGTSASQSTKHR